MTDLPEPHDRDDAVRGAREALAGSAAPDAATLAAVRDGLRAVPAGSPNSWFDVPSQRLRRHPHDLKSRHAE
jgi:hypothetical protein